LLRTQLGYVEEETGDISAGPRQRLDPARSDGIGLQIYPDDRHRCLGLDGGTNRVRIGGEQDIDPGLEKLADQGLDALEVAFSEPVLDHDILAEHIPQLP